MYDMADVASVHKKGNTQLTSVNSFCQLFFFFYSDDKTKVAGAEFTRYFIPMPANPACRDRVFLARLATPCSHCNHCNHCICNAPSLTITRWNKMLLAVVG